MSASNGRCGYVPSALRCAAVHGVVRSGSVRDAHAAVATAVLRELLPPGARARAAVCWPSTAPEAAAELPARPEGWGGREGRVAQPKLAAVLARPALWARCARRAARSMGITPRGAPSWWRAWGCGWVARALRGMPRRARRRRRVAAGCAHEAEAEETPMGAPLVLLGAGTSLAAPNPAGRAAPPGSLSVARRAAPPRCSRCVWTLGHRATEPGGRAAALAPPRRHLARRGGARLVLGAGAACLGCVSWPASEGAVPLRVRRRCSRRWQLRSPRWQRGGGGGVAGRRPARGGADARGAAARGRRGTGPSGGGALGGREWVPLGLLGCALQQGRGNRAQPQPQPEPGPNPTPPEPANRARAAAGALRRTTTPRTAVRSPREGRGRTVRTWWGHRQTLWSGTRRRAAAADRACCWCASSCAAIWSAARAARLEPGAARGGAAWRLADARAWRGAVTATVLRSQPHWLASAGGDGALPPRRRRAGRGQRDARGGLKQRSLSCSG